MNPVFFAAWGAFILVGGLGFWRGWHHHQPVVMILSLAGIAGFTLMIILAMKHNRRVERQQKP